jgi:hypothetical protein
MLGQAMKCSGQFGFLLTFVSAPYVLPNSRWLVGDSSQKHECQKRLKKDIQNSTVLYLQLYLDTHINKPINSSNQN